MIRITVGKNEDNQRLDRFLRKYLKSAPLSFIYKLIRKDVKINGKRAREDYMLAGGDEIVIYMNPEELNAYRPVKETVSSRRQFKIAYEDENILAAEKPFGLLTHGDKTEKKRHLANQVISYLTEKGEYNPQNGANFYAGACKQTGQEYYGARAFWKKQRVAARA